MKKKNTIGGQPASTSGKRSRIKARGERPTTKRKSRSPRPKRKPKIVRPKTQGQYSQLSDDAQDQWIKITNVIQRVRREGVSLTKAARESGISRKKVVAFGGSALKKQANGRYAARSFDRLLRVLIIPSPEGLTEIAVRDSRTASKIGEYSAAVQRFIRTGDQSKLRPFKKLKLKDASGKAIKLLVDPKELMRLGNAGVLSFESIYARVA